jgi:WD40 repeat protein
MKTLTTIGCLWLAAMSFAQDPNSGKTPLAALDAKQIDEEQAKLVGLKDLVALVRGHTRAVSSLAFSKDDRLLASSSWDNNVLLWMMGDSAPKEWATIKGSPSRLAFAPDGKTLACGAADTSVYLWSVTGDKPKQLHRLAGHKNRPFVLAVDPKGKLLASGCFDPVLRLWKVAEAEPEQWAALANESAPALGIASLSFSHDGKYLAAGNHLGQNTLRIWNTAGAFLDELELPKAKAKIVAFSPKEPLLAFASEDEAIRFLSLAEKEPKLGATFAGHPQRPQGQVLALAFAPDGQRLASAGKDRKIMLWSMKDGKKLEEWTIPEEPRALAFAHDNRHLAIGSEDGSIYVLRLESK